MEELRTRLRAGEPVVGNWVSIGHPTVAEIAGSVGADFVTVDTEHAPVDVETVENLVRAVDAADGESTTIVRVPSSDPVTIKRVLDTGPGGIMVPRVQDAAEAETVVEATRYPPDGIRGTAAGRAADYGQSFDPGFMRAADESIARILQVETEGAVEDARAIADVEGVDALFVGPADLSAAVGTPLDYGHERFREAVETVTAAGEATDTPVGIFVTDPGRIDDWLSLGCTFAIAGFDAKFLVEGARELQSAIRTGLEDA